MQRRRSRVVFSLLVAASIGAAGGARAQPAPAADTGKSAAGAIEPGEEHFRRGNAFYKEQKWAEAEASFEAALALKRTHDIASNLGHAELKQGKHREAAEHLALSIRLWPPTGNAEKRAYAVKALEEARAKVGELQVMVSAPGAELSVDGKVIGKSPLEGEVFVDVGPHVIEAKLSGHEDARQAVEASAGATQKVALTLRRKAETGPDVPPVPKKRSLVPGVVLGGVAVAGLGTSLGLYLAANGELDTARELTNEIRSARGTCKEGAAVHPKCAELESAKSTGRALDAVAIGSLVVGGLAAAGAVVYVAWPAPKRSMMAKAPRVGVAPVMDRSGGGIVVVGSF